MALLECPECHRPVSDQAVACPHCGLPAPNEAARARTESFVALSGGLARPARPGFPRWPIYLGIAVALAYWLIVLFAAPAPVPRPPAQVVYPTYTGTPTSPPTTATAAARRTATAAALAARTATALAIDLASPWTYSDSEDDLGRGATRMAWTMSTDSVEFDFPYQGAQRATLTLRKSPKHGLDVILSLEKAQFLCDVVDGCVLAVRFGNGTVRRFGADGAADHSTNMLFLRDAGGFIASVRKATSVRIEATFYQEGARVFTFDTQGLKW